MIVVDVGCMPHGREESVRKLIGRFQPDILFGFDPHPDLVEGVEHAGDTVVVRKRAAAWIFGGQTLFKIDGICSGVAACDIAKDGTVMVDCFDLAAWLRALPVGEVVLKLDAEGAEYPLLARLHESGLDGRLQRVIVEWHPPDTAHGLYTAVRPELRCDVEEWE